MDASGVDQSMLTASESSVPLNGVQDGLFLKRRNPQAVDTAGFEKFFRPILVQNRS